MADPAEISAFLQNKLQNLGVDAVAAIEAAHWLDRARLLRDSPDRPGKALRERLRAGQIAGGRQDGNRWYIHKLDEGAPLTSRYSTPSAPRLQTMPTAGTMGPVPADPRFSDAYRAVEFSGFLQLGEAIAHRHEFMAAQKDALSRCGVYAVFASATSKPEWIIGEKLPNVLNPWSGERLARRWVPGVELVYIGCAGRTPTSRSLRERIGDLLAHGTGKLTTKGPHKGGERLWQCRDWQGFTLAWRVSAPYPVPHDEEVAIGTAFQRLTGALPFANERL